MTPVDSGIDDLRPVLADALGAGHVEPLAVRPLSAGASRLTWALELRWTAPYTDWCSSGNGPATAAGWASEQR